MYPPEPLRNNPFRFRKRKSLHSMLYGQGRSALIGSSDSSPGYGGANTSAGGYSGLETYMSELPEEYIPNPGPMQVPGNNYQPYDDAVTPSVPPPNMLATEAAGLRNAGPHIEYADSLLSEELFEHQLKQILLRFQQLTSRPLDMNAMVKGLLEETKEADRAEVLEDITQRVLDLQDGTARLMFGEAQEAVEQCPFEVMVPRPDLSHQAMEPAPIGLRSIDYLGPISQDFFGVQAQLMERQFSSPDVPGTNICWQMDAQFSSHEALFNMLQADMPVVEDVFFDQMAGTSRPIPGPAQDSLEQIVEAFDIQGLPAAAEAVAMTPSYDDCLMDSGLFEQQMREAADQIDPAEPLPDQMNDSNDLMPQPYDPQMQQMMDPYMMPGPTWPGPMMDPGPGGP